MAGQRDSLSVRSSLYVTTTFVITPTIMKKTNDIWKVATEELSSITGIISVNTYQQFPPQWKNNPNAMGLDPDAELEKRLIIQIISIYWPEAKDYDTVKMVARDAMDQIEVATKNEGAYHPFKYANYAGFWQNVMESYGDDALRVLRETSQKYDPHGVFQKQVVGFKL
jgi:hypothetical protein